MPLCPVRSPGLPGHARHTRHTATPADLQAHHCITHAFGSRAEYRLGHAGRVLTQAVRGNLSSNEIAVVKQATLVGAGIAMLPTYFGGDELRRGTLVRVLPAFEPETLGIHAALLSLQLQPLPLKLLVDFLAEGLGGQVAPLDLPL
jgi:DNA-binding transcriptional LysR family regulator